jgi:hypothetical protein
VCEAPRKGYPLGVWTVWVLGGLDLLWRILPLSGELIRCQSDHGDYACYYGEVVMSGGDGTYSTTRVPTVRRASVSMVMACLV